MGGRIVEACLEPLSPRSRGRVAAAAPTAAFTLAAVLVFTACTSGSGNSLSTSDAWARPASAGADTAVYVTIANTGSSADALVSASSPKGRPSSSTRPRPT